MRATAILRTTDETRCPGCGREYENGECLSCDGDGNPWDGRARLRQLAEESDDDGQV